MKKFLYIAATALLAVSCLFDNDMAYPDVPALIENFEVEGQVSANIDNDKRSVSLVIGEREELYHLRLKNITLSEGAVLVDSLPEYLDLTDTLRITVRTYVDYEWTVTATQPIARYIKVENQIGDAELDLEKRDAIVYVSESQSLANVRFLDVKLEPEGSEVLSTTSAAEGGELKTEKCSFPMSLDCVHGRTFLVEYDDALYEWTMKVLKKKISQQISSVEPWCRSAKVYGLFSGSGSPSLEYRKTSDTDWTTVEGAVVSGVGISADIRNLEEGTEYAVRVAEDGAYSDEYVFKTGLPVQLADMKFDNWYLSGKIWYPYAEGTNDPVWDSANPGAATFIGSSTTPEEEFVVKGKAARLESKYAVIAFAAGNIYTGKFGKIAGIGAELDWGVPFDGRPKALKGWYSYSPKKIDNAKEPHTDKMGQSDKCQILVCLTDWDQPFRINTTTGHFVDFENDPHIIAYANLQSDEATDGYVEFTLPLEYRSGRTPKYAVIACAASYLGDYFTGGVGSLMYVDEFEFIYE